MDDGMDNNTVTTTVKDNLSQIKYHDYFLSEQRIGEMIKAQAKHMTQSLAKVAILTLKDGIASIDLSVSKSDMDREFLAVIAACNLVDGIKECLLQGGDILQEAVHWNFDFKKFLKQYDAENNESGGVIVELQRSVDEIEALKPSAEPEPSLAELVAHSVKLDRAQSHYLVIYNDRREKELASAGSASGHDDDMFEDSAEYEQYAKKVAAITAKFNKEASRNHLQRQIDYKSKVERRNVIQQEIDARRDYQEKAVIVKSLVASYTTAISQIIMKVKNVVKEFPEIESKLSGHVTLPHTGQYFNDPYQHPTNLTAIYEILYCGFNKANMVIFCKMLMELLADETSQSESASNPMKAVSSFTRRLRRWQQMDLFKYMDQDKLFTITLLRNYHPQSKIRVDGLTYILRYANTLVTNGEEQNPNSLPLFTALTEWIEILVQSQQLKNIGGSNNSDKKPAATPANNNNNKAGVVTRTEQVAAAQTAPPSRPATTVPRRVLTMAEGLYSERIGPERGLCIVGYKAGTVWPYTATDKVCSKCHGSDANKKCNPPCLGLSPCDKCKLFGHKTSQCLQQLTSKRSYARAAAEAEGDEEFDN